MTFGEKLFELRKKNGFSQEELAEKIGVSRQAVSRWEIGETMPDSPNLLIISNLFGVSADYLLRDEIESKTVPKKEEKNPVKHKKIMIFYIFGLLAMASLLYIIALSDLDIIYWIAGTVFLFVGIITAILYFKNPEKEPKSPLYLAASIIFFASAVLGFCAGNNIGFLMGIGNFVISAILFIIWKIK